MPAAVGAAFGLALASVLSRIILRFLETDEGLIAFVTLGLDPGTTLADAHRRASEVEEKIRLERPEIADVIVHTEP